MIETVEAYGLSFRIPARDTHVGASLRDHGEFARPELDFLLDHATGDHGSILDVGANIGALALPLAAARPGWKIVAYEPSPLLGDLLAASAELNGLQNLELVSAAAGPSAGCADFPVAHAHQAGNFGNLGFHWPEGLPRAPVPMVTLDGTAPDDVRVVKIDVQGFEADVLRGSSRLIDRTRPVWLVEADSAWAENFAECHGVFLAAGYSLHWFFSPFATPQAKGAVENLTRGDTSMVALPEGVANRWSLPPVLGPSQNRPGAVSDYPFLKRYGY